MKNVKLTADLLIGEKHHEAGAVLSLPDLRADQLVRSGHAEGHVGSAEVANPEISPLADFITPEPPVSSVKVKGGKLKPEDSPPIDPTTTADEVKNDTEVK